MNAAGFGFVFFVLVIANFIAWKRHFYRFPYAARSIKLSFLALCGAFFIYLFSSFVILPLLSFIVFRAQISRGLMREEVKLISLAWYQIGGIALILIFLSGYLLWLKRKITRPILWGMLKKPTLLRALKKMGLGSVTWLLAYPAMVLVAALTALLTQAIFGRSGIEQPAVAFLRDLKSKPIVFSFLSFSIVVVIPIVEEVLFRGFLQTWLNRLLGRGWAIALTAVIFSLAHIVPTAGVGNIELISSLFVLSCYLGFLYERETTLLAPLGLHMTINAVTVASLFFMPK